MVFWILSSVPCEAEERVTKIHEFGTVFMILKIFETFGNVETDFSIKLK